jgi:apolipoprotein D and lipocalin family protein
MCNSSDSVKSVAQVDLNKYAGTWYEIASFPQRFQKGCYNTTATYSLSEKGYVIVENRCLKDNSPDSESYIKGKAFVVPGTGNAQLKVQFFWPFRGKYWIIDLAEDYSYAVVGHPNKKYLWILSRTQDMPENIYNDILLKISIMGFDTTRLVRTIHK